MTKTTHTASVAAVLDAVFETLTPSERALAAAMRENYPISALGTITELADAARVSTPTVARMAKKLGYDGFPHLQSAIRAELERQFENPIAKRDSWNETAPQEHILNSFADAALDNIRRTMAKIDLAAFEAVCAKLADPDCAVMISGGRLTQALATYLKLHLEVIRPRVSEFAMTANAWPHAAIDIEKGDVVAIFDIRRYEKTAQSLAETVKARGGEIILFTDQWRSPVSAHASAVLCAHIEAPSAWDSSTAMMLLIEAIIARVQESNWPRTKKRMERLETLFDDAKLFQRARR